MTDRLRRGALLALCGVTAAACASAPDPELTSRVGDVLRGGAVIQHVPLRTYPLAERTRGGAPPAVVARFATAGEVSTPWPASALSGASQGGALAAIGIATVAVNPMAQAAAVGGIIALPALTALGIAHGSDRSTLLEAVAESDLPAHLQTKLAERIASVRTEVSASAQGPAPARPAATTVEVVLPGFGFVGLSGSETLWFHCDAEVRVTEDGREVFRETIWWRANRRSEGVPPPRYETLSEWAADDARDARETLTEAADVLAALIARELGFRP